MTELTSAQTLFAQSADVVGANVAGDTVLMNINTSVYLEIDEIGARIWTLLEQPRSFAALTEVLMREFDVDEAVCASNTDAFLSYLAEHGFLAKTVGEMPESA